MLRAALCRTGLRWGLLPLLCLLGLWPTVGAGQRSATGVIPVPNPGAELWRAVRQRQGPVRGQTQVGGRDSGVLIDTTGERFRDYRREDFVRWAGYLLAGVLALIAIAHLLHGPAGIPGGPGGQRILRFDQYDRVVHWLLALLFLFLALTGLLLLFGRFVIIPWLGNEAYAPIASAGKEGHNLFGPLFVVALVLAFIRLAARNLPHWRDLVWLFRLGGLFGRGHPSAGFFNGGEKLWFWALMLLGGAISASGLLLDFPALVPGRQALTLALVVHGAAAVVLLAAALGHIYMGSVGVEGTLQGMTEGSVDENWARAHHDLWYAEVVGRETAAPPEAQAGDAVRDPPEAAT